jgi:hypothetical protein
VSSSIVPPSTVITPFATAVDAAGPGSSNSDSTGSPSPSTTTIAVSPTASTLTFAASAPRSAATIHPSSYSNRRSSGPSPVDRVCW